MALLLGIVLVLGIVLLLVLLEKNTGGNDGGAGCVTIGIVGVMGFFIWWQLASKGPDSSTPSRGGGPGSTATRVAPDQFNRPAWMVGEWRGPGRSVIVFATFSSDGAWTMTFGNGGGVVETWGGTWWSVNGSDLRLVRSLRSFYGGAPTRTADTKVVVGFNTTGAGIVLGFSDSQIFLTRK